MSLTAHNFQFYTYNMPRYSNMDVDDIDMSIPPPKPKRTFFLQNNKAPAAIVASQMPQLASTPTQCTFKENHVMTTVKAATAAAATTTPAVGNETPKSICSSGLLKGTNAGTQPIDLQLRPKLQGTQSTWSSELRDKAFEISRRNSAVFNAEHLKLEHQDKTGCNRFSREIREKALAMSKRNSGSFEKSTESKLEKQNFGMNSTFSPVQEYKSSSFQTPLINVTSYEKIHSRTNGTKSPANKKTAQMNKLFDAFFNEIPQNENPATTEQRQSVRDRICFFNKLTSSRTNSFIDLLKNNKTLTPATKQHSSSAQTPPLSTPLKPNKSSKRSEIKQGYYYSMPGIQSEHGRTNASSHSSSSPICAPRKSTLRRRTSLDKSRHPISRQNSTASSNGTKLQMHSVMEDLSLVIPVKMRVEEYERRIMMKC